MTVQELIDVLSLYPREYEVKLEDANHEWGLTCDHVYKSSMLRNVVFIGLDQDEET